MSSGAGLILALSACSPSTVPADAGATWTRKGKIQDTVQAAGAVKGAEASPTIWAATASGLVLSTDGGVTFRPADAS